MGEYNRDIKRQSKEIEVKYGNIGEYTPEEIMTALKTIRNICLLHNDCDQKCPFHGGNSCTFTERVPLEWELIDEQHIKNFHAFI